MNLVWKIAAGIVLGFVILFGLQLCGLIVIGAAIDASVRTPITVSRPYRTISPAQQIDYPQATPLQPQNLPRPELPAGERCVGKQLFRKLSNGFEQVTDGSAVTYCQSTAG